MNEANTMADILGLRELLPNDPAAAEQNSLTLRNVATLYGEEMVLGFCGYLTADIPELHKIHPQSIAESWERFKKRVAEGFKGVDFEPGQEC